jgi:hypothetical protein
MPEGETRNLQIPAAGIEVSAGFSPFLHTSR